MANPKKEPSERSAIAGQLRDRLVPLDTADPTAALGDPDPLRTAFEGRTIVGMGESTHGTREFFQLKHRLFRFLVEELDFRLFGLEAGFTRMLEINEYVVHGRGDPKESLFGETIPWPWRSEAVLDLIEWMRAFNDGHNPADRVKFYGFDMQFPQEPAAALESILRDVDPELLDEVHDDLTRLTGKWVFRLDSPEEKEASIAAAKRVVTTLTAAFDERGEPYREATSREEFRVTRRQLRTIEQAIGQAEAVYHDEGGGENIRIRDEAMAENVSWILEHESTDKIALWGHNAHVKRGPVADGFYGVDVDSMGENLAAEHGDQYYALGFDFGHGSFRTVSVPDKEFVTYTVAEPPEESLPDLLGTVDRSMYLLDLTGASHASEMPEWFTDDRRRHMITGRYDDGDDSPVEYVESNLSGSFDGLVFVSATNPSIHLEPPENLQ